MKSKQHYIVLTADIVDSRKIENFPSVRDRTLQPLGRLHTKEHRIVSEYAVTAWDEFEGILTDSIYLPEILLDLRRRFYPLHLRIGLGMGEVSNPTRTPVNRFAGGIAFERARKAIKKTQGDRSTRSTLIISGNEEFDDIINGIYQLHDALVDRITEKQWAAINVRLAESRQNVTARKLGLDPSLVSRLLKRGSYAELVTTRKLVKTVIAHFYDRS